MKTIKQLLSLLITLSLLLTAVPTAAITATAATSSTATLTSQQRHLRPVFTNDALTILKSLVKLTEPLSLEYDFNGNGYIDTGDALEVLKSIVKMRETLMLESKLTGGLKVSGEWSYVSIYHLYQTYQMRNATDFNHAEWFESLENFSEANGYDYISGLKSMLDMQELFSWLNEYKLPVISKVSPNSVSICFDSRVVNVEYQIDGVKYDFVIADTARQQHEKFEFMTFTEMLTPPPFPENPRTPVEGKVTIEQAIDYILDGWEWVTARYIGDNTDYDIELPHEFPEVYGCKDVYYFAVSFKDTTQWHFYPVMLFAVSKTYEGMYWSWNTYIYSGYSTNSWNKARWTVDRLPGGFARTVRVISGGKEYVPIENWHHGWGGGYSASGWGLSIEQAVRLVDFATVPYHDDFHITLDYSDMAEWSIRHTLYDENLNVVYTDMYLDKRTPNGVFEPPAEPGVYYLCYSTSYTNHDGHGSAIMYWVKLVVTEPRPLLPFNERVVIISYYDYNALNYSEYDINKQFGFPTYRSFRVTNPETVRTFMNYRNTAVQGDVFPNWSGDMNLSVIYADGTVIVPSLHGSSIMRVGWGTANYVTIHNSMYQFALDIAGLS